MAGDPAVGMIEVQGVVAAIVGADAACKAADVTLAGWSSIGGYTTAFFTGSISDVAAALRSGEEAAREIIEHVVAAPLLQPAAACSHFVDFPVRSDSDFPTGALGLVETRGYGAHIHTNDQMVKTAAVEVVNVLTIHDRVVCSLVLGDVGAVNEAIAVAQKLLADCEHLLGTALIPQPRPEVLAAYAAPMGGSGV
ncbi:MAG: BMC domain-containing protein [Gemmatimonadota bacterium]|nr:BMC domain-containing protein [Gemmatimonadota bacterium]